MDHVTVGTRAKRQVVPTAKLAQVGKRVVLAVVKGAPQFVDAKLGKGSVGASGLCARDGEDDHQG
jgi:hypothetical protein